MLSCRSAAVMARGVLILRCSVFGLLAIVVLVSLIVTMRTLLVPDPMDYLSRHHPVDFVLDQSKRRERGERFAESLAIPTISWGEGKLEAKALLELHRYIFQKFPKIHNSKAISYEVVNNYSLLYKIQGQSDDVRKPYLLAAHLDVVPADESKWTHPPFEGKIVDNVVWGRGAMDDKQSLLGILEALESLLAQGFQAKRTFYVAFGHDEEMQGWQGAGEISMLLKERGIEIDFVIDEGGFLIQDEQLGLTESFLTIAVAEKGFADLEYSVESVPGHSSAPPDESALGILAGAVSRLEKNKHASQFGQGPERAFFTYLAPHVSWGYRALYSNLWLLDFVLLNCLKLPKYVDGMHRTTTAVTIFQSGFKSNVVPGSATATVNHRIHPSQTLKDVLAFNERIMADSRIHVRVKSYMPAPPIAPYGPQARTFNLVAVSARQAVPNIIVVPSCTIANTDLRHYAKLTNKLYRVALYMVTPVTMGRIHGHNEQLSLETSRQQMSLSIMNLCSTRSPDLVTYIPSGEWNKVQILTTLINEN